MRGDGMTRREFLSGLAALSLAYWLGQSKEGEAAETSPHPLGSALETLRKKCPGFTFTVESEPKSGQPVILYIPEDLAQLTSKLERDPVVQAELEILLSTLAEGNSRLVITPERSFPRFANNQWTDFQVDIMRGRIGDAENWVQQWEKNADNVADSSLQQQYFWRVRAARGSAELRRRVPEISRLELLKHLGAVDMLLARGEISAGTMPSQRTAAGLERAIERDEAERERLKKEKSFTLDPFAETNYKRRGNIEKLEARTPGELVTSLKRGAKAQLDIFERARKQKERGELTEEQLAKRQPALFVIVIVDMNLEKLKAEAEKAGVGLVTVKR